MCKKYQEPAMMHKFMCPVKIKVYINHDVIDITYKLDHPDL